MKLDIRRQGIELFNHHKYFLEAKIRCSLSRFQDKVRKVSAFLSDINGPKGGMNKRCRVLVHLKSQGSVVVQHTAESVFASITGAMDRLEQAVRRKLTRKRTQLRQKSRRSPTNRVSSE